LNNCYIICLDFETGGLDVDIHPPIEIAARVLNPRTLEPVPDGLFYSMMCPPKKFFDNIQDDALRVNGKTREQVAAAPAEEVVWPQFTDFVLRYKTKDGLPIPAGQNIRGFDLLICERLCKLYGPYNKKQKQQMLWHKKHAIDLYDISFMWFENSNELDSYSMRAIRPYFGISEDGAHTAMKDVDDTYKLITRFMRLHRKIAEKTTFRGSFLNENT
jgi:DNA polymerase III epsilon subunit-like protein